MNTNSPRVDVSHHITGNHPTREITEQEAMERQEPRWIVAYQAGFEQYQIAVYGDNLCGFDACGAAQEWLESIGSDYADKDADYVFRA